MSPDTSYADEYDALQRMIAASNRTLKECAAHLYPHHKPETAYARLKTKLDPNGTEQFKFYEVVALMVFCERFDPLFYICDETLHHRPERRASEDEQARLVTAISQASETLQAAMRQLERLQEAGPRSAARGPIKIAGN